MRVLLLRAKNLAQRSAESLRERGAEPILAPLLAITFSPFDPPCEAPNGLIAASAHVFAADLPVRWRSAPLFLVGARTQAAAEAAGFSNVAYAAEDGAALAEHLSAQDPQNLYLLAGRHRKKLLETQLPAMGHRIKILEIYRAAAVERLPAAAARALQTDAVDAVLHYSRRSAQIFVDLAHQDGLAQAASALRHVALSDDVAAPLRAAGWRAEAAPKPNESALFALLDSRFAP